MSTQMPGSIEADADALTKTRLEFAERCFINAQELSRFMDQKASFLLSAVALMTGAAGILAARAVDASAEQDWQVGLKGLAFVSFLVYASLSFVVLFNATRVFRALPNILPADTAAPGLIFPLILLQRYKPGEDAGEDNYYSRLQAVGPEDILHDYANQIVVVSSIYQRKQEQINRCIKLFQYLNISWITVILLLLLTIAFG